MKHKIYWEQRMKDLEKSENKILKKIYKAYKGALKEIELLLSNLYVDMMEDGAISPANLYKFDRYTTLEKRLKELIGSVGEEEQLLITDWLREEYKRECQQYAEFMGDKTFYNVYPQQVEAAVKTNWSGEHFSRRIWDNKSKLVEALNRVVVNGVALGVSRQKMNKMILKEFDTAYYCADRLVRTESMFIYNRAHYDYYKQAGIVQYEFLAEIDDRTSRKCKNQNGNVYALADAEVGWNYPPLHPNCRSTVIPVIPKRNY